MLRKAQAELPPTLDETYDRILCAIDNDHSTYALRILHWLAFSARPLLIEEIVEVVAIEPAIGIEEIIDMIRKLHSPRYFFVQLVHSGLHDINGEYATGTVDHA